VSTGESTAEPGGRIGKPGRKRHSARTGGAPGGTRVQILKAAAKAFRRLGYHGATVEEIAAALHMKKGNLYYYFRNKEEILFACHQYSLDRLLAILDEIERSGVSPEQKLRGLIGAFVHTILDELHGTALGLDLEALSPAHLRTVITRRDRFDKGMREVLKEGIRSGTFVYADAKLLSFAILGAVNWIPRWYSPEGPSTSEEIADKFAEYLIAGLRKT
jgi:AcrR family transcriptional regulator